MIATDIVEVKGGLDGGGGSMGSGQFDCGRRFRIDRPPRRSVFGRWQNQESRSEKSGSPKATRRIEAHYEGQEIGIISGLTSKEDVNDWLNGPRKIEWLRSQGYAK